MIRRPGFENFKSAVCHRVRGHGDISFIIDTLERQDIHTYYDRKWYPESLYLLAMLDYLSRENGVPLCDEYDDLRRCKLNQPIFPASIRAMSAAEKSDAAMKRAAEVPSCCLFLSQNIPAYRIKQRAIRLLLRRQTA